MTDLNTRTPTGDDATQRNVMKPAFSDDLFEAGLITLVSPIVINYASISIIGFDAEYVWLTGDSGEGRAPK